MAFAFACTLVAFVLLLSGAMKLRLRDQAARNSAFGMVRFGRVGARTIGRTLGVAEIVLGATLLLAPSGARMPILATSLALFGSGMITAIYLRARRPGVSCGCFGNHSSPDGAGIAVVRDAALVACCAWALAESSDASVAWSSRESLAGSVLAVLVLAVVVLTSPEREAWRAGQGARRARRSVALLTSSCGEVPKRDRALRRLLRSSEAWLEAAQHHGRDAHPSLTDVWTDACWLYGSFDASFEESAVTAVVRVNIAYPQLSSYALTNPDTAEVFLASEFVGGERPRTRGEPGRLLPRRRRVEAA